MGSITLRWLPLAAACVGCGGATRAPTPEFVSVEFRSAIIGPTKVGGAPWDGMGAPRPGLGKAVGKALSMASAETAVLELLAGPVLHGLDPPEPFGDAVVMVDGVPGQRIDLKTSVHDTLTPPWDGALLTGVPLRDSTVIKVRLYDRDLVANDAIGDCNLRYRELVEALRAGDVHPIRVADQTAQQLLFLAIAVYAGK